MKQFLYLFSIVCLFASCGEPEESGLTVEEYILENNLVTRELDEGVHIVISALGNDKRPNINSRVRVSYEGRLTTGEKFDSSNDATFDYYSLIEGWRIGLKELGEGGSCTLIIPPNAAYGSRSVPGIAPNSTLVFDMSLLAIL